MAARLLHVALPVTVRRRQVPGIEHFDKIKGEMKEAFVPEGAGVTGKRIVDLNIPYTVHIMAIRRKDHFVQPIGSTKILAGDTLYLLADDEESLNHALQTLNLTDKQ
jgi:cell volume regulation protein A